MSTRHAARARLARGSDDLAAALDGGPTVTSAPLAVAAFFLGWVLVGLTLAWVLVRRGHDPRLMTALGIGLGPLVFGLLADGRDPRLRYRVLRDGVDRDGDLDVLIVLRDHTSDVRELDPTLHSLRHDVRRTTIVTTVPYECIDPDPHDRALPAATDRLLGAAALVAPIEPQLVVLAGHPAHAPTDFARVERYGLTLHARR